MDEADRILNMDFEPEINKILKVIPRERRTYLYSATMTKKVSCTLSQNYQKGSYSSNLLT